MGDVVKFPVKDKAEVIPVKNVTLVKKFIIDEKEFVADSVTRPVWFTEEWHVHTLEGPTHIGGPMYWAPLTVVGPEELADAIQGEYPLRKMSLEILDPTTGVVEDWWEFQDVYLSTETEGREIVIFFREAITRDEKSSDFFDGD